MCSRIFFCVACSCWSSVLRPKADERQRNQNLTNFTNILRLHLAKGKGEMSARGIPFPRTPRTFYGCIWEKDHFGRTPLVKRLGERDSPAWLRRQAAARLPLPPVRKARGTRQRRGRTIAIPQCSGSRWRCGEACGCKLALFHLATRGPPL